MQVGIPIVYNVCEVKLDKINQWICVHREDFQLRWCIKIHVKSGISYRKCTATSSQIRHTASKTQNYYVNPKSNGLALVPVTYLFVLL